MEIHLLFFFIIAPTIVLKKASCSCTVPAAFNGMKSDTLSSSPVNFADSNNIIWEVSIYGETFPWRCEDTGPDLLFLRSKTKVSSFPTPYFFYACLQFKTVSDTTLYYYMLNDKNAQSKLNARLEQSDSGSLRMCDVCKQSAVGSNDYNVMSSTGTADKSAISNPSLGADPCALTTTALPTTITSTAAAITTATSTATETTTVTSTVAATTTETPTVAATTTVTSTAAATTTMASQSTSSEPITTTASSAIVESCSSAQDNNSCSFKGLDKTLQKEYEMDKSNACMSSCKTTNINNNSKEGTAIIRIKNIRTRGKRDTANVYFFVCILFKQTPTSYNMYYWTDKESNGTLRYVESTKHNLTLCEICDPKIIPDNSECESIQTDGSSSVCVNLTEDTDPRFLAPQCSSKSSSQEIGLIVVAVSVTVSLVLIGLALIVIFISLENRRKYLLKPIGKISEDKLGNYELKS